MSESRTQLEEILELLLAEENEKAEEMLHEYVVAKARAEYENILDEDSSAEEDSEEAVDETVETDEDAVEETVETDEDAVEENIADIDPAGSLVDEILQDEEEIEGDEVGEEDGEEMGDMEAPEEEGDLEDKVDDISAELDELKAEFEKLLADDEEEGEEVEDGEEAELEMGDELELETVEYDLDEEVTEEDEVVEEATKLSDNVAAPTAPTADNNDAPLPSGGSKVGKSGSPIKITDGGDGNKGDSAKDHTPTDNIKVEPKKV
ncbi:nucleolar 14 family protein [bacterium]|nr:nucleolar 14 family protein [bacterium]